MSDDLISRRAAVDALEGKITVTGRANAKAVREYANTVCDRICRLPSAQRWIPCSERLPEDKKAVYWVCNDYGNQFECRWTDVNHFWTELKTKWHWNLFDVPPHSKVVAWMPLPEPYKEESDG